MKRYYDGPPGKIRLHEPGCPRNNSIDDACTCWLRAQVVDMPGGQRGFRRGRKDDTP